MKARQTQKQNITKPLSSLLDWRELVTKLWQTHLNPNYLSSVCNYLAQIMAHSPVTIAILVELQDGPGTFKVMLLHKLTRTRHTYLTISRCFFP